MQDQWRLTHAERMQGRFGGLEGDLGAMLSACGIAATPALLRELARLEEANWTRGVALYEDTHPQLALLRRRGLRLAIVSNASPRGWCGGRCAGTRSGRRRGRALL